MSEYLSFWLAKIVVEMAVAGVLIAILFAAWFICFLQRPMVVAIWSYTIGYFVGKS